MARTRGPLKRPKPAPSDSPNSDSETDEDKLWKLFHSQDARARDRMHNIANGTIDLEAIVDDIRRQIQDFREEQWELNRKIQQILTRIEKQRKRRKSFKRKP